MHVLPESHLKVHAATEKVLADELIVFAGFFFALGSPILLLVVSIFSSSMGLPMRTLWPDRQCCQEAKISAAKHLDFLSKISTGISTGLLNFPLPFSLIWQKTYDLATLARALCSPARPFSKALIF
jgi:hypothetical protein